jgi:hypothetical protein
MRKIYSILFVFISSLTLGQTTEQIIKNLNKGYTSNDYLSCNLKYNLYKNVKATKIHETYIGVFKKNKTGFVYQKISNTEFIMTNKTMLKVMHDDNVISVAKPSPFGIGDNLITSLLTFCKIESCKLINNTWKLVLIPKDKNELNYNKIEIYISKNYKITKQKFYYNIGIDFSESLNKSDVHLPVLEIVYSNYSNAIINETYFSTQKYVTINGDKITPTKNYINYQIEDNR